MGFAPRVVDAMTFPEFAACGEGFRAFHGGDQAAAKLAAPSDAEVAAYRASLN